MLARLLIVVLILVGQFPLRVCTCGAAHAHATLPPPPAPDTRGTETTSSVEADHRVPHHHDCPAASPRPCMKPAPLAVAQLTPADDSTVTVFAIPECEPAPLVFAEPPPVRPPPVPLFVTFCSLRK